MDIDFEKRESYKTIEDLIQAEILKYAQMPQSNPDNIHFKSLTVPLIDGDYPAKTPVMWNEAYKEFGMDAGNVMMVADKKDAQLIYQVLKNDPRYVGGGCGSGFKINSLDLLDEIDPWAKTIGSVNLVQKMPDGRLLGHNTDGLGFVMAAEELLQTKGEGLQGKKALLLGAGGTADAIAFELAKKRVRLVIANRTQEKANILAKRINNYFGYSGNELAVWGGEEVIEKEAAGANFIINATKKGATGDLEEFNALGQTGKLLDEESKNTNNMEAENLLETIPQDTIFFDIILGKETTPFLKAAERHGHEIQNGLPMVVYQAVEAFWIIYREELAKGGHLKDEVLGVMKKAAGII